MKIKNLSKVSRAIKKKLDGFLKSPTEMKKAGNIISSELATNYRVGRGADDKPFPDLAASTIKRRKVLALYNRTDQRFRPGFSNITFSGRFVRSRRIKSIGRGSFEYSFSGSHKGHKQVRGGQSKAVKNSDIASGLTGLGYKLAGVPIVAKERIVKQFRRYIRRNN